MSHWTHVCFSIVCRCNSQGGVDDVLVLLVKLLSRDLADGLEGEDKRQTAHTQRCGSGRGIELDQAVGR